MLLIQHLYHTCSNEYALYRFPPLVLLRSNNRSVCNRYFSGKLLQICFICIRHHFFRNKCLIINLTVSEPCFSLFLPETFQQSAPASSGKDTFDRNRLICFLHLYQTPLLLNKWLILRYFYFQRSAFYCFFLKCFDSSCILHSPTGGSFPDPRSPLREERKASMRSFPPSLLSVELRGAASRKWIYFLHLIKKENAPWFCEGLSHDTNLLILDNWKC